MNIGGALPQVWRVTFQSLWFPAGALEVRGVGLNLKAWQILVSFKEGRIQNHLLWCKLPPALHSLPTHVLDKQWRSGLRVLQLHLADPLIFSKTSPDRP